MLFAQLLLQSLKTDSFKTQLTLIQVQCICFNRTIVAVFLL